MKHRYLVVVGLFGILLAPLVSDAGCERIKYIRKTCNPLCEQVVYVGSCQFFGNRTCVDFCQVISCCGGSQTFEGACDQGSCYLGPESAGITDRPRLVFVRECSGEFTAVRTISLHRAMLSN